MRRYATVYYLLFVLLVMGAFASMAQNSYGLKICGIACLGFALTFIHEIFFVSQAESVRFEAPWLVNAELIMLSIIALVFLFRNFSNDFPFSNTLLIISLTGLLLLFSFYAFFHIQQVRGQKELVYPLSLYYGAVLLFILSFLASIIYPAAAFNLSLTALLLISVFAALTLVFNKSASDGEATSIWLYLRQMKNKSSILLIVCILTSGYSVLYSTGILPAFYYGTPKGYQDLVKLSSTRSDNATKAKYHEFQERYDSFVKKYSAP